MTDAKIDDRPSDTVIITTLMQEIQQLNDQRLYMKAQIVHLRTELTKARTELEAFNEAVVDNAAKVAPKEKAVKAL